MTAFVLTCVNNFIAIYTICSIVLPFTVSSPSTSSCSASLNQANDDGSSCIVSNAPYVDPLVYTNNEIYSIPLTDSEASTLPKDHRQPQYTKWPTSSQDPPPTKAVYGCCSKVPIGHMPQMTTEQSKQVLHNAILGWNNGRGLWSQKSLVERIKHVELFVEELKKLRDEIAHVLMWEIGKTSKDAISEVDRTIQFIQQTIETIRTHPEFNPSATFTAISSSRIFARRNGVGIVLCLGPYNYPLNETYAALIPALLMGNIAILKIPTIGGLSHILTFKAFQKSFPNNTVHFISGSGRQTLPPLMESGEVNQLSFIGGTSAADLLIKQHPNPHRLKVFLQLEAKNMGILLPDLFESKGAKKSMGFTLSDALDEVIRGALSFNGQRCTALKLIFAPRGFGKYVAQELAERVEKMKIGMPWQAAVQITPLPNTQRIEYMKELIDDALSKGSIVWNEKGGTLVEDESSSTIDSSTLLTPAVLFPVTKDMTIYKEEQFGPIIPVVEYDDLDEMITYGTEVSPYGQQVSIFSSSIGDGLDEGYYKSLAHFIDSFSLTYGKININSQCARSPDSVPFTARKSSGLGIMSIADALKEFSVPTVVSYKFNDQNDFDYVGTLMKEVQKESQFMSSM